MFVEGLWVFEGEAGCNKYYYETLRDYFYTFLDPGIIVMECSTFIE